jgi:hypothetical protein
MKKVAFLNEQTSESDYCEFDLIFKETLVDYKNGNTLVVPSGFAPFLAQIPGRQMCVSLSYYA